LVERREVLSTLTVTSSLDGGAGTLRAEIAAAQSGDTIVFDPSLDGQTITLSDPLVQDQLEINTDLTIQGPGSGLLTILGSPGENLDGTRVFQVDAGANVTISGLTIEGGNGVARNFTGNSGGENPADYDGCGGGILNLGTLTLSGCNVHYNYTTLVTVGSAGPHGYHGGGIANFGTMTLSGDTVTANSTSSTGGGIYNLGTMTLSGSTSTVAYNSAAAGGGIYNDFQGQSQGHLTALSSVVQNNSATDGGGIENGGTMTLSGSTVAYNSASDVGGGIANNGTMTLSGDTVTGNSASTGGGGIDNGTPGNLTILSSVVENNTAPDGADILNLGSMTISKDSKVGKVSHK
jgi:hypothetical protein